MFRAVPEHIPLHNLADLMQSTCHAVLESANNQIVMSKTCVKYARSSIPFKETLKHLLYNAI